MVISLLLLLLVDFLLGERLLGAIDNQSHEKKYRIGHPVYHHTLAPDYDGYGAWGSGSYRMCTDSHGFKSPCDVQRTQEKQFDLAFIGDSFTEGIGLPYEETFVGRIAAALPGKRIANLGVVSYSPSIYLAKIQALLKEGFRFKEVVVFVDISDIQDEAVTYRYQGGVVTSAERTAAELLAASRRAGESALLGGLKDHLYEAFPLIHAALSSAKQAWTRRGGPPKPVESPTAYLERGFPRAAWTYDPASTGYGALGVEGAIAKSIDLMTRLHGELERQGIALSVAVYPWPAQLLHDVENSRQVQIWREFCLNRCRHFHDSFPSFFERVKAMGHRAAIGQYFMHGDVHHNADATELIARDFLRARADLNPLGAMR